MAEREATGILIVGIVILLSSLASFAFAILVPAPNTPLPQNASAVQAKIASNITQITQNIHSTVSTGLLVYGVLGTLVGLTLVFWSLKMRKSN